MRPLKLLIASASVALILVWFILFRPGALGGSAEYLVVSGASMQPNLYTGDVVITRRYASYHVGEVVAYHANGGTIIHRIVGGDEGEGFEVKGDNNSYPDQWRPKPSQIAGKQWLYLPGAGRWALKFRQPSFLAAVLGIALAGTLQGSGKAKKRRKRGMSMGIKEQTRAGSSVSPTPANVRNRTPATGHTSTPIWLGGLFAFFCGMAAVSAIAAWVPFRSPTQRSQSVERLRFEQTASFDYTASVDKSSLYPTGTIGPVSGGSEPGAIYSAEPPVLDLQFHYALRHGVEPPPLSFTGDLSAQVRVSSGEQGWSKTLDLLSSTPFTGTSTEASLKVDLPMIQALIKTIETETKYVATSYEITVVPTVHITGKLGASPVDDTFAPPFAIKLNRSQVVLDPALSRSETRKQEDRVNAPRQMNVFGMGMSVSHARVLTASVAGVSLAGAVAAAAVIFLGLGRGEAARIRARYGSRVISVAGAYLPADEFHPIRLASIQDLMRLASKDGRMVFHQVRKDGSDVYFIQDGSLTYLYASSARAPAPVSSTVQEA